MAKSTFRSMIWLNIMELPLAKIKKIEKIMNEEIIGRADEKKKLAKIMNSKDAEFLVVYGRRRVGKTFLVRHFFKGKGIYFELGGEKDSGVKSLFLTKIDWGEAQRA